MTIPQLYEVHFIVIRRNGASADLYYVGNEKLLKDLCNERHSAAYNCSVNITTLESEEVLDIVNDYIVTVEWRALEVDSTSNIFKQSTWTQMMSLVWKVVKMERC